MNFSQVMAKETHRRPSEDFASGIAVGFGQLRRRWLEPTARQTQHGGKAMTKLRYLIAAALAAGLMGYGSAAFAQGTIDDTKHDFDSELWNPNQEQCQVCHTPHASDPSQGPLWDRLQSTAGGGSFIMYPDALTVGTQQAAPVGVSLACLSCHDGTVALDSFGGNVGLTDFIPAGGLVGIDLSNDHPVSISYDGAPANLKSTPDAPLTLYAGNVECASCHDPHSAAATFLRTPNTGSALCKSCHLQ